MGTPWARSLWKAHLVAGTVTFSGLCVCTYFMHCFSTLRFAAGKTFVQSGEEAEYLLVLKGALV